MWITARVVSPPLLCVSGIIKQQWSVLSGSICMVQGDEIAFLVQGMEHRCSVRPSISGTWSVDTYT
jgi:hypothetical protein